MCTCLCLTERAGCFQTELLQTLVHVALSCAPGAAFVLADICTVEWADKTAEYWSSVPVLPLVAFSSSLFIYSFLFQIWNDGMSCSFNQMFLHSLFCLQCVSTVYNSHHLLPQQPLSLWWFKNNSFTAVVVSCCRWKKLFINCALFFFFSFAVVVIVYLPLEPTSYRNRLRNRNYFPQWSEYECSQSSSSVTLDLLKRKTKPKKSSGSLQAAVCGLFVNFHTFFSFLFAFHPFPTTLSLAIAAN